LSKHPNHFI